MRAKNRKTGARCSHSTAVLFSFFVFQSSILNLDLRSSLLTLGRIEACFILLSLNLSLQSTFASDVLSLDSFDGTEWQVFPAEGLKWNAVAGDDFEPDDWVPGVVPGTVFVAYVEAGREENPDWGDNIYRVDETFYNRSFWYRTTFPRPVQAEGRRTILTLEGINRYAWVCFNGKKLGQIKGHVQKAQYDVTDLLRDNNTVAVRVDMPDSKHTGRDQSFVNYVCPTYVASHSWDWMPYVPGLNCGITNDIYLEFTGYTDVLGTWVRSFLNDTYTTATLAIETEAVNLTDDSTSVTLLATIRPGNYTAKRNVTLAPGETLAVAFDSILIDNPRLWWPNGSGPQNLYTCTIVALKDGMETGTTATTSFGIREYRYRTENTALTLYVNGQKTFCKGGNWGMSDYLLRCHRDEYDRRIRLHADMHYNMIRLWTGCVTDEEFYEACDRYGIMVWDDFWLTGPYTGLTGPDDTKEFLANAQDKVIRLRNHPSLCVWCGCNEGTPYDRLNESLADIICRLDGGDRLYQPNSHYGNGLSGSGWWKNFPPEDYFAKGIWGGGGDLGDRVDWGFRSELGMGAFTTFESFCEFMPEDCWWTGRKGPQNDMWEKHFFSNQAAYGGAADASGYFDAVVTSYGQPDGAESFCEKAQFLNIEVMKAIYEGWQDNLWNTASGILFWMSQPAYPCFIWQTYDYYYDATGCYWGARKGCEPLHIQWNCSSQRISVVNTSPTPATGLSASIEMFRMDGTPYAPNTTTVTDIEAPAASVTRIWRFTATAPSGVFFIRLKLFDAEGMLVSENFYWKNKAGNKNDFTALGTLPRAELRCTTVEAPHPAPSIDGTALEEMTVEVSNLSSTTAFGIRVRLVDERTGQRILPATMEENYFTLFAGETRTLHLVYEASANGKEVNPIVLLKQYGYPETDGDGHRLSIDNWSTTAAPADDATATYDLQGRPLATGRQPAERPKGLYIQRDGASHRIHFSR
ncbi:MAG: hypothetical protein IK011_00970 [Bacteroidaceae bacterium]|nr:hypothetical protein [Bacteroidaceae bacterium]